jgi:hypothetical protein
MVPVTDPPPPIVDEGLTTTELGPIATTVSPTVLEVPLYVAESVTGVVAVAS